MPPSGPALTTRMAAVLVLAVACAVAKVSAGEDAADLTGRWRLDRERSDDARKKVQDAMEDDRRRGFGGLGPIGPGPRSGGPMGGGPVGGRPMGGLPQGAKPRDHGGDVFAGGSLARLADPPATLVVTETAGELTFDSGEETLLRLRPDGRKVKREGGAVELKARWKDGELVIEAEREEGPATSTTYRVTSDRRELHVTTRFETRSGDEVVVRHVYDAAPAR